MYIINKQGIETTVWTTIKKLNENLTAKIATKHGHTRDIKINDSIRQGGVVLVIQYTLLTYKVSKEIKKQNLGTPIHNRNIKFRMHPDNTICPPDNTICPPDNTICPPDNTRCSPDTTICPPDNTISLLIMPYVLLILSDVLQILPYVLLIIPYVLLIIPYVLLIIPYVLLIIPYVLMIIPYPIEMQNMLGIVNELVRKYRVRGTKK